MSDFYLENLDVIKEVNEKQKEWSASGIGGLRAKNKISTV